MAKLVTRDLTSVPLFAACSKREIARIEPFLFAVTVPSGSTLTNKGTLGHEAFVIVDGRAMVEVDGQLVAIVEAGEVVGEMALLTGDRRCASVHAVSTMELLVANKTEFFAILDLSPTVRRGLLEIFARRLRAVQNPIRNAGTAA